MSLTGSDTSSSTESPFSPLDWTGFFETKRQVSIPKRLDSSGITFTLYEINGNKDHLPVFLLHHGAGHCALSFAATARELGKLVGDRARIISIDARGHGETTSNDQLNLHVDRLAMDVRNLVWTLFGGASDDEGDQDGQEYIPTKVKESKLPKLFLVGHSMGGAVVTNVVYQRLLPNVVDMAVLDIVEVVKPYAFIAIRQWCENRPSPVKTVEQAIQWAMEGDVIRNLESARVSIPGMIVRSSDAEDSTYEWRMNLLRCEQYWTTWFDDLTQKFLEPRTSPRQLLILGGATPIVDELKNAEKEKRFQLSVFAEAGHAVEEDDPTRMAQELFDFSKDDLGL